MSTGYLYDKMGLAVMAYVPPLLNHCWVCDSIMKILLIIFFFMMLFSSPI